MAGALGADAMYIMRDLSHNRLRASTFMLTVRLQTTTKGHQPTPWSVTMSFYINNKQVSQKTFFAEAGTATNVWVDNCHGLTALTVRHQ
jgi:hypothetical protein